MKLLKTIGTQLVLGVMFAFGIFGLAFAQGGGAQGGTFTAPTDGNTPFNKSSTDSAQGIGVAKSGTPDAGNAGGLLGAVKTAINRVLGLLALIALCICLWAGWKMLTAAGDAKAYGDGFTMLRQAAVGLIMIGISWLLVSFIFWVIGLLTGTQ